MAEDKKVLDEQSSDIKNLEEQDNKQATAIEKKVDEQFSTMLDAY